MHLGTMPVMRAALDPIAFFVIAIIVFNIIASIVKSLRKALGRATSSADAQARQRLTQALQPKPAPDQITVARARLAAARAAELARLRQALLASAGISDAASTTSPAPSYTMATQTQPPATPVSTAPILSAMVSQVTPTPGVPDAQSTPVTAAPPGWSLQAGGSLMTLESAATAFERLAIAGSPQAAAQAAAAAAPAPSIPSLAVLQLTNAGANLVVASAIVGPPAAFRSIGHTPGSW